MALTEKQKYLLSNELELRRKEYMREAQLTRMNNTSDLKNLKRVLYQSKQAVAEDVEQKREIAMKYNADKQLTDTEMLAFEMVKLKDEENAALKIRQQLRACPELMKLQSQLRWGYSNKSIDAQLHEKAVQKQYETCRNRENFKKMTDAIVSLQELRYTEEKAKIEKKLQYRSELQDQIILREKFRKYDYELRLQEKNKMDDIIQRMNDEDQREVETKYCKRLRTQQEIDEFKKAQQEWKRLQKETLEAEHRRNQELILHNAISGNKSEMERIKKDQNKIKIAENIAKQIYNEQALKKEKEDTIQDLLDEERKAAINKRHKEDMERIKRSKEEIRNSLAFQIQERKKKREDEARQDAIYKEQVIAKSNEEMRLQQEKERKKKDKLIALRIEGEEIMRERRRQFAMNKQLDMQLQWQKEKEQEAYDQQIADERERIIEEHARHLRGFLPPNTLTPDEYLKYGPKIM